MPPPYPPGIYPPYLPGYMLHPTYTRVHATPYRHPGMWRDAGITPEYVRDAGITPGLYTTRYTPGLYTTRYTPGYASLCV